MTVYQEAIQLFKKDIRLEFRNKAAVLSALVYVIATIFVCYQAFKQITDAPLWNALLWIIILFAAVNAVARSFQFEQSGQQLFYYTLVRPEAVLLGKIAFNSALITGLALVSIVVYGVMVGYLTHDTLQFLVVVSIGSTCIASLLTTMAAIAGKTGNSAGMIAVLGFPLMIPLLITTIKASKNAMGGLGWDVNATYILMLLALNALIIVLGYVLFPYLWRE